MSERPYEKFTPDELILRDQLALDRTLLANERTLMAYQRTALTLVIAGIAFLDFATTQWPRLLGVAFIPAGIGVAIFGVIRFQRMRRAIAKLSRQ